MSSPAPSTRVSSPFPAEIVSDPAPLTSMSSSPPPRRDPPDVCVRCCWPP
ncbi:hypothetical protein RB2654_14050 [Rhodobacterales bacterium HTCC2654]|uniref:Uncharacterized protein n=1 Tax=Maritimibacter alkaliphilus HTCC2654 TaxID=314271 RepID=A3VGK9_9RHOB|nr:hypothetical protein RB2654_14050 [Rhodobacterales bacterium HTCC2654] [Maritimibacter alkaliphilus HTCC2654]